MDPGAERKVEPSATYLLPELRLPPVLLLGLHQGHLNPDAGSPGELPAGIGLSQACMKPALSGLGGAERRKVRVNQAGLQLSQTNSSPYGSQLLCWYWQDSAHPLLPHGWRKLPPASRLKHGLWSSQQKPPTQPLSLSSPPPAPSKEACRLGWAPQHPGELSFSSPEVIPGRRLPKGPERGGGFPWELSARGGICSAHPRVTERPGPRGSRCAALENAPGVQGALKREGLAMSAGKGGELQLRRGRRGPEPQKRATV